MVRYFMQHKRWISLLTAVMLLLTATSSVFASGSNGNDVKGHWAEKVLSVWTESGLLNGYADGSIKPDQAVTRAEYVALINRSFDLSEGEETQFTDVPSESWANQEIGVAVKHGYVKGYSDNTFRPNQLITREHAAIMIAALLQLEQESAGKLKFNDADQLSELGASAIAALLKAELITGFPDGTFKPAKSLTRAQAVFLLEEARHHSEPATVFKEPGVYGPESGTETIRGDVIVAAPGITLRNVIIRGNLTVSEQVGEGEAYFKGVRVDGETIIQGGGINSIHFEDSVIVRITVNKQDGSVRIVVAGSTTIDYVMVQSPVKLEESYLTDTGIKNVNLTDSLPQGSQVELLGQFENVNVLSSNIKVNIPQGSVANLHVYENTGQNEITLSQEASVLNLVLDSVAALIGKGTIETAVVNKGAESSSFETDPQNVEGTAEVPSPTTADGGSVVPGAVTTTAPTATPVPTTVPTATPAPTTVPTATPVPTTVPTATPVPTTVPTATPVPTTVPTATPVPTTVPTATPVPTTVPTATPSPCISEGCQLADLTVLKFGDFTLDHLNQDRTLSSNQGFDPDAFEYSVINDLTAPQNIQLDVTTSVYASVNVFVTTFNGTEKKYKSYSASKQQDPILIAANPGEDIQIRITVTSGDKLRSKYYNVIFHKTRTIQESFKLNVNRSYNRTLNEWSNLYNLVSGVVNGELLRNTDEIQVFASQDSTDPISSGTLHRVFIPSDAIEGEGTWYIKVLRDNVVFAEGEYTYSTKPLPLITEDIGIEVVPLSKQELIQAVIDKPWITSALQYGTQTYLDASKLLNVLPDAKYYSSHSERLYAPTNQPMTIMEDQVKPNTVPEGFHTFSTFGFISALPPSSLGRIEYGGSYSHVNTNEQQPKIVYDQLDYFVFYDSNYQTIGYVVIPVQFDADHVADGYTPVNNWTAQVDEQTP